MRNLTAGIKPFILCSNFRRIHGRFASYRVYRRCGIVSDYCRLPRLLVNWLPPLVHFPVCHWSSFLHRSEIAVASLELPPKISGRPERAIQEHHVDLAQVERKKKVVKQQPPRRFTRPVRSPVSSFPFVVQ